ncbi:MAG: hypothetical protein SP4CHLAM5_03750 [Chlamydiia bacterium]|nr:hypothetical protein [Chlamydiia bacterium]MCH9618249.1 hypothetical protein [Chlamydiia bacterium]
MAFLTAIKQKSKQVNELQAELTESKSHLTEMQIDKARLEISLDEQAKSFKERLALIDESKEKLKEVFKGISTEALEKMEEKAYKEEERRGKVLSELVKPMKESLGKLDEKMSTMEKERKGDKEALTEQMRQVVSSEKDLLKETKNLKDALSKPEIRGMWGEMQLKRVIEVSGMVNNCDFLEQSIGETEGRMRPDMVIKLAGDRCIIVDAKAPFEGFLKALSTDSEAEKLKQMERHARHLRTHIQMLSKKKYYEGFTNTPEFVVLFLPSEVFFSAAMQVDPTLMEYGASLGVILSTPTTLIGLLRSVAYGWKSETVAQHAKAIQSLGQELYKRLLDMSKHLSAIGRSLNSAVEGYNKTVGTYERRVLSSARKFQDLGATSGGAEIALLEQIEAQTRNVKSVHLDGDEVTVE